MNELSYQYDIDVSGIADHSVQASGWREPAEWLFDALAGSRSPAGVRVNPVSALRHSPVWTAINVISGDMAQLPTEVIRERISGERTTRTRDPIHVVDQLLNVRPNEYQTPYQWKEMMTAWALSWGNAICRIRWADASRTRPLELIPLMPDETWYDEEPIGSQDYVIQTKINNRWRTIEPQDTFHIRGLTSDGFWGLSSVRVCQDRIGYGMALQRHGSSTFANGALPGGLIEQDREMNPDAKKQFREDWNTIHQGPYRSGRVGMLPPGMHWKDRSMSNSDAEWLEATELDLSFVAACFLIPPYKIGSYKNSSVRANLEMQQREYVTYSLSRWGHRFEQEAELKLLRPIERRPTPSGRFYLRTNYSELVEGNYRDRAETAALLVRSRIITQNEGREGLGYNPVEGGDEFSNPAIESVGGRTPDEGTAEEADSVDRSAVNDLIRDRVHALLTMEMQRVERQRERGKRFDSWLIGFYERYESYARDYLDKACRVAQRDWRPAVARHADAAYTELKSGGRCDDSWLLAKRELLTAAILEA